MLSEKFYQTKKSHQKETWNLINLYLNTNLIRAV